MAALAAEPDESENLTGSAVARGRDRSTIAALIGSNEMMQARVDALESRLRDNDTNFSSSKSTYLSGSL